MKKLLVLTILSLITTQGLAIDSSTYNIPEKIFRDCFTHGLRKGIFQFVIIPEGQTQYDGRENPVDNTYERDLASEARKHLGAIIDTLKNNGTVKVVDVNQRMIHQRYKDKNQIYKDKDGKKTVLIRNFNEFAKATGSPSNMWHTGVMLGSPRFVIASGLGEVHDPNEKINFKQYSPLKDDYKDCSTLNATALELAKKEIRIFKESAKRYSYAANCVLCHDTKNGVRVKNREIAKAMEAEAERRKEFYKIFEALIKNRLSNDENNGDG